MPIPLPPAQALSSTTLTQALAARRSRRQYGDGDIDLRHLAQLLWAAQGSTGDGRQCTAPSAGAQYPMETRVVAGRVEDLAAGVYRYRAASHQLEALLDGDLRQQLCAAALEEQPWVAQAALVLALVADVEAMQLHFAEQPPRGERGERYVYLEAGAMAQNIALQATALGLGAVLVGGFDDDAVAAVLDLPAGHRAGALLCIGNA